MHSPEEMLQMPVTPGGGSVREKGHTILDQGHRLDLQQHHSRGLSGANKSSSFERILSGGSFSCCLQKKIDAAVAKPHLPLPDSGGRQWRSRADTTVTIVLAVFPRICESEERVKLTGGSPQAFSNQRVGQGGIDTGPTPPAGNLDETEFVRSLPLRVIPLGVTYRF